MGRDKEDIIDIREPINFALLYVLFEKLANKFGFPPKEVVKWSSKKFIDEINRVIKGKLGKDEKVNGTAIKNIISKLNDNKIAYKDRNTFEISPTLNLLCLPLIGKGQHTAWDEFRQKYLELAKKKLIQKRDFFYSLKENQLSILVYLKNYMTSSPSINVKELIEDGLRTKLEGAPVNLIFHDSQDDIHNEYEAAYLAKRMNVNMVIYGRYMLSQNGWVMKLNYLFNDDLYKDRLNNVFRGSFLFEGITDIQLFKGNFLTDFDQALFLISALKFYLEFDIKFALHFLEKINEGDRCDEAWYMIGVCQYEINNFDEAGACWKKTIEKTPSHLKARVNMAILLTKNYVDKNDRDIHPEDRDRILLLLQKDLFQGASTVIKFKIAQIYDLIGEKDLAREYYEVVLFDEMFPGRESVYLLLGILTTLPEYIKAAAIQSENIETHKLCIRWICKSDQMDIEQKISLLNEIRNNFILDQAQNQIEEMYSRELKKLSISLDQMMVLEINGIFRKNGNKDSEVKIGDVLDYYDSLESVESDSVMLVLLKNKNFVEVMGLKSPPDGQPVFAGKSLYSFLEPLREVWSEERVLLLHSFSINKKWAGAKMMRVKNNSDGRFVDLFDPFTVTKPLFNAWIQEGERCIIPVSFQAQRGPDKFETIADIELLFVDDNEIREKIGDLNQYLNYEEEDYFSAVARYLTDFYAYTKKEDVEKWLCGSYYDREGSV